MTKYKEIIITLLIVIISFLIRVYRLDIPHDWSFDEVYHALSAEAYALNDPRGYEWWNPSPKDLAYEWLHPPLGKLFMAASIKIFAKPYIPQAKSDPVDGATTFAWRFPGTIFAALTVWLLIIFGKKLFNNFWIGVVAGGLYGLDGLSFVQSRTGMNDIYITFFVVLTFYRLFIFIKDYSLCHPDPPDGGEGSRRDSSAFSLRMTGGQKKNYINLFWIGIASGLAASTKWTGFYAVGIVGVWGVFYLLKKKDWATLPWGVIYLGLIPFVVYILSYSQWWLQGHTLKQFYELHQQIWWYQTGLKATHGYQSQALTWPFLYRPVWFYVKYEDVVKNGVKTLYIGNIYTMGNPFIWWAGLISILYLVFSILEKIYRVILNISRNLAVNKDFPSDILAFSIILVGYFGMFVPWALSPRIMFLYHYLPSVPFLCLGLAYGLGQLRKLGQIGEYTVTGFLVIVVLAFIYFYPHWSALPLPQTWVDKYYWLPSWK